MKQDFQFNMNRECVRLSMVLNESVCNSKQKWNHDECWCECKELDDWGFVKMIICGILARVIVNVIKYVKLINIQILKLLL